MEAFGIEIIEKTEIMTREASPLSYIILAITVVIVMLLMCFDKNITAFLDVLVVIMIGGYALSCSMKDVPTGRYQYKVFVDSPEDVKYLYLNYDVIETSNHVYVVEDKEETNP